MRRKLRDDRTVGALERNLGLPAGTIRNSNGRDTRSDKLVKTIRKEAEKKGNRVYKVKGEKYDRKRTIH